MDENVNTKVEDVQEENLSQTEVVSVETVIEHVAEEKLSTEEVKVEEKLESKSEEKVEIKEELSKENVQEKIEATKEELGLIQEVREELVNLYSNNKELSLAKEQLSFNVESLNKDKESLSNEIVVLKSEVEKLTSELHKYKEIEEQLALKAKNERLEKLSAKFKVLGQSKSAEELSEKSEESLSEFEKIVDAAIEKLSDSIKESPAVTISTQAEKLEESKVEKKTSDAVAHSVKSAKPSTEDFFKKICGDLTKEQSINGIRSAKKF